MTRFLPPGITEKSKIINIAEDDIPVKMSHHARFTEEGFVWSEFHGASVPRPELGRVGDIWIDFKMNALSVHWKSLDEWIEWNGLDQIGKPEGGTGPSRSCKLTAHPIIPTFYLWVRAYGASWATRDTIMADLNKSTRADKARRHMWPLPVRAKISGSNLLKSKEKGVEDRAVSLASMRSPSSVDLAENVMAEDGGAHASILNQAARKKVPRIVSYVIHTTSSLSLTVSRNHRYHPVECQLDSAEARTKAHSHSRE